MTYLAAGKSLRNYREKDKETQLSSTGGEGNHCSALFPKKRGGTMGNESRNNTINFSAAPDKGADPGFSIVGPWRSFALSRVHLVLLANINISYEKICVFV